MTARDLQLAIVVLAAGESRRLGQRKQGVVVAGRTLLEHAARLAIDSQRYARRSVTTVHVICGRQCHEDSTSLAGLPLVVHDNPDYAAGIATSVACAATVAGEADGALLLLLDQYRLTETDVAALIARWESDPARAVATDYDGVPGAPAIWPRRLFDALRDGAAPRPTLIAAAPATLALAHARHDLDTPADLAALRNWEQTL